MGLDTFKQIVELIVTTAIKSKSFGAYVIKKLIIYLAPHVYIAIKKKIHKEKVEKEQAEARKKLEEVFNNPESTVSDVGDAYADAINAGRVKK